MIVRHMSGNLQCPVSTIILSEHVQVYVIGPHTRLTTQCLVIPNYLNTLIALISDLYG